MTTAIDSIYQAVHDMNTSWSTDVVIAVWDYDELDAANVPSCPNRMLSIVGSNTGNFAFVLLGTTCKIEWTIDDTIYLKPAKLGESLKENSKNIVRYIGSYITALRALRAPTTQSYVSGLKITPGVYYWPDDATAGVPYIGVQMLLTIEEVISN